MADPHWTSYIGMATGIVGAITGISGALISYHSQRQGRENRLMGHRLDLQMKTSTLTLNINRLEKMYNESLEIMRNANTDGLLSDDELRTFEQKYKNNSSQIERLWEPVPKYGSFDYSTLEETKLEARLVAVHNKSEECLNLTKEYESALATVAKEANNKNRNVTIA